MSDAFHCDCLNLEIGGDDTISYKSMLTAIQRSLPNDDPATSCHLIPIPNRLLFFLSSPLLLRSPKAYEAILRMSVDLSGFKASSELVGSEMQPFPMNPFC